MEDEARPIHQPPRGELSGRRRRARGRPAKGRGILAAGPAEAAPRSRASPEARGWDAGRFVTRTRASMASREVPTGTSVVRAAIDGPVGFGITTHDPSPAPGPSYCTAKVFKARAPWAFAYLFPYGAAANRFAGVNSLISTRDVRFRERTFRHAHPSPRRGRCEMAQFVGKPLPISVKLLAGGALGAKTSLKGLAAGRPWHAAPRPT